jgi:hypothetical protein
MDALIKENCQILMMDRYSKMMDSYRMKNDDRSKSIMDGRNRDDGWPWYADWLLQRYFRLKLRTQRFILIGRSGGSLHSVISINL